MEFLRHAGTLRGVFSQERGIRGGGYVLSPPVDLSKKRVGRLITRGY